MSNYNFKNFFSEKHPAIHNNEYVSNALFLIKKSILKKSQLEFVNSFPMNETKMQQIQHIVENESKKSIISEFIPQLIIKNYKDNFNYYNILIMELENGYKNVSDWLSKIHPVIQEKYYNFILSLKCKVCIINKDQYSTLAIYNNDNEFVGIILPVKVTDTLNAQDYNEYLDNLKVEQDVKKLSKQNSKKCLYIKDNKAVIRNKELIHIADITNDQCYENFYIEKCIQENKDADIYLDLGVVCIYVRTIQPSYNKDEAIDYNYYLDYFKDKDFTLEKMLTDIRGKRVNNQFINVADIKLMKLSGVSQEEVQELIDYRQNWYNEIEKNEQEKRLQREQKDKEYMDSQNKITEELVLAAEQAILNKQEVKNCDITIYKSRYNSSTTKLILYMMKQYGINVPLKTQGWINQALTRIQYSDGWGDYTYNHYKSSANSTVFNKYLNQLIRVIKEKYAVAITV